MGLPGHRIDGRCGEFAVHGSSNELKWLYDGQLASQKGARVTNLVLQHRLFVVLTLIHISISSAPLLFPLTFPLLLSSPLQRSTPIPLRSIKTLCFEPVPEERPLKVLYVATGASTK